MSRDFTTSDIGTFTPEPAPNLLPPVPEDPEPVVVSIFDNRSFEENRGYVFGEDEYDRDGRDPGLVLIFNYQKFDSDQLGVRTGTNRDVNELLLAFGRLGYNINENNIFTNLTRAQTIDTLNEVSQADFTEVNSLIVVVLTHGDVEDELHAKDAMISTQEFWSPFSSTACAKLKGKPKFFIFQACKGKSYSQTDAIQGHIIPTSIFRTPLESDMLIAFAAVEGSQSYRNLFHGTWFIQELCRNFCAFGRRDDVVSLLIRTTKCVATNYFHEQRNEAEIADGSPPYLVVTKQMPLFFSTLTKKFYLNRNKDRDMLLRVLQQQDQFIKALEKSKKPIKTNGRERSEK